jgi:hypothetical protein
MEYSIHYIENKKLYGLSVTITKSQNKNYAKLKANRLKVVVLNLAHGK